MQMFTYVCCKCLPESCSSVAKLCTKCVCAPFGFWLPRYIQDVYNDPVQCTKK